MIEDNESIRVTISPIAVPWSNGHDRCEVHIHQCHEGSWTIQASAIFAESRGQNILDAMAWISRAVCRMHLNTQQED